MDCKKQERKQLGQIKGFCIFQIRYDGGLDLGGSSGGTGKTVYLIHHLLTNPVGSIIKI